MSEDLRAEQIEVTGRSGRIRKALAIAMQSAMVDGAHHKDWVIDQMVRALTGCPMVPYHGMDCYGRPYDTTIQGESCAYLKFIQEHGDGEDGPNTYVWDVGIPP